MNRYEYLVLQREAPATEEWLNSWGQQGWELITTEMQFDPVRGFLPTAPRSWVFKRQLPGTLIMAPSSAEVAVETPQMRVETPQMRVETSAPAALETARRQDAAAAVPPGKSDRGPKVATGGR